MNNERVRLLFVGDVIGKPGRRAVQRLLHGLIDQHGIDYVIVNVENAAGGIGVTTEVFKEMTALPTDCFSAVIGTLSLCSTA